MGMDQGASSFRQANVKFAPIMLVKMALNKLLFFSCEDVDIAWRAHLAGWGVLYVPTAVVYHKLKATGGDVTGSYYDGRNFLYLLWKNYPGSLLRRHWRQIFHAQLQISGDALRAWRGSAARARLRGQLAGLWGIFKMLPKRRHIQAHRCLDDQSLLDILTPIPNNQRNHHESATTTP